MKQLLIHKLQLLRMVLDVTENRIISSLLASILIIGTCLLSLSCRPSETTKPDSNSKAAVPRDFQLVLEEGGGFTGLWSGYIVDSSGNVSSWRGNYPERKTTATSTLSRQQLEKLWQTISDARFFDIDTTGTGNMTIALQVTANGTVHRTSWAQPSGTQSPLPPVQKLYDSCRVIVTSAK